MNDKATIERWDKATRKTEHVTLAEFQRRVHGAIDGMRLTTAEIETKLRAGQTIETGFAIYRLRGKVPA